MTGVARLVNRLHTALDAVAVPFAIGGSFALAARGHPRFTADIDVMVLCPDPHVLARAFDPREFDLLGEATFRDHESGLTIDMYAIEDDAQRWAFDGAILEPFEGARPVRVLTPDGLALMLLREASHGDPKRRPLRLRDIELMAINNQLDRDLLASWATRMGYDKAFADVRFG